MAPKLTEEEIDDLIYFARAGEDEDLVTTVASLAERENATPAEIIVAAKDEGKSTCLHMATGNGHMETVRKLIGYFEGRPTEEKQAYLDDVNAHGNTGLHWAALGGHLDIVKLLVDNGASPVLANEADYVPLDLANLNGKRNVAEYFLAGLEALENKNQESGLSSAAEGLKVEDGEKEKEEEKTEGQ